ncbi:MAG TPA: rhodanese-like domain-containing protein [Candidatus Binataceae bacterium]
MTHREVLALAQSGAANIVETLPLHEYRNVHIRGAIHLPLSRLWSEARPALATGRPIIVYCRDSL